MQEELRQPVGVRLVEEGDAESGELSGNVGHSSAGAHDNGDVRLFSAELPGEVHPVEVWHLPFGDYRLGPASSARRQTFDSISRSADNFEFQRPLENLMPHGADLLAVVNQDDSECHAGGLGGARIHQCGFT